MVRKTSLMNFSPVSGSDRVRHFLTALGDAALVFWILAAGPLCWILRDGLGPNSVESAGSDALVRFLMTFWWAPILAILAVFRLMVLRRRSARPASQG